MPNNQKCYIIKTYSGYEAKVVSSIKEKAFNSKKKTPPGFILVKMRFNDSSCCIVNSVQHSNRILPFINNAPSSFSLRETNSSFQHAKGRVPDKSRKFLSIVDKVLNNRKKLELFVTYGKKMLYNLRFDQVEKKQLYCK